MLECIKKEIQIRKSYLNNQSLDSIYFGGGTPSILKKEEIKSIIEVIQNEFTIKEDIEITLECNPDDLTEEHLKDLIEIGVNRLSIGIQSFNDEDLKFMNRSHNAKEANNCILLAKKVGFKNITIDLIYGLPNQSLEKWEANLDKMFNLGIQHFSAYSLTIEDKTVLKHQIEHNKVTPLKEETTVSHFNLLVKKAKENKFIHYEISNFGKKGYFSNHNTSYWKNKHYLGIGPSAHSFNGFSRQWNVSSNKKYIDGILNNTNYFEIETLTKQQQYNEYIFTSLRTIWGVDKDYINKQYNQNIKEHFYLEVEKWIQQNKIKLDQDNYILTKEGKLYADAIASDLFMV